MKRVVVAIINWNCAQDTIDCCESIIEQLTSKDAILIIDNNSRKESIKKLSDIVNKYTNISLIKNQHNSGFSGGANKAIAYAQENNYKYVSLVNPDGVVDKRWLTSIMQPLSKGYAIATGPVLTFDKKSIDTCGEIFTSWGIPYSHLRNQSAKKIPTKERSIFGATGGSVVYKTSLFTSIGNFDPTFFMYFEDIDISFRAQLRGFKVGYHPGAILYHKRGASSKKVPGLTTYNTFKNLPMLFVKNVPLSLCFRYYPRFVLAYTLILGNAIKNGNGAPALKGWLMSWRYLGHMLRERWHIQRSRTVSDTYIDSIVYQGVPPEQMGLYAFVTFLAVKKNKKP